MSVDLWVVGIPATVIGILALAWQIGRDRRKDRTEQGAAAVAKAVAEERRLTRLEESSEDHERRLRALEGRRDDDS